VLRLLDLIGQRDGVILERDAAALLVGQKLILTEAERAGARTVEEQRRRREKRPVKFLLLPQQIEEHAALGGFVRVRRRKLGCRNQRDAGRDFEAARTADHQIALRARRLYGLDQLLRVACGKVYGADDGIVPLEQRGETILVEHIALLRDDVSLRLNLLGIADNSRDLMTAAGEFLEDRRTGAAGGSDQCDFHHDILCDMWYLIDTN